MKRANGSGTIVKLTGARRRPYAIKLTLGYTEEGKLQYKYLSYHKTHREAERALAEYNKDPYSWSKYTFKELYDEFYAIQEQTKAVNTLKNHKAAIKHLEPLWNEKVKDIDRATLQSFYSNLKATPSVVNNIHRTLQGVIRYAVKLGIMPLNMLNVQKVLDMEANKEGKEFKHTLITKEEREFLWKHKDNDVIRIILFYIYTGLRFSELHDLQPENIHDGYIEIIQAKTKAGKRIVPICDRLKALGPIPTVPSYPTFHKCFTEALPNHMIHDTRHTFVTMMTEAEIDIRIIQSIVGHAKKTSVTDIYTHITLEKMTEAVNKLVE